VLALSVSICGYPSRGIGSAPVESAWWPEPVRALRRPQRAPVIPTAVEACGCRQPGCNVHILVYEAAESVSSQWSNRGAGDQEVVEALGAPGPDGAFRDRVRTALELGCMPTSEFVKQIRFSWPPKAWFCQASRRASRLSGGRGRTGWSGSHRPTASLWPLTR
jgi:hypothetical protein